MSLRRRESGLEELLLRPIVGQAVATTNTVKNFTSDVSYQETKTKGETYPKSPLEKNTVVPRDPRVANKLQTLVA